MTSVHQVKRGGGLDRRVNAYQRRWAGRSESSGCVRTCPYCKITSYT